MAKVDLIQHHFGEDRPTRKCLDHGFVSLVDVMPRLVEAEEGKPLTADFAICQAARVSYAAGTKSVNEDRGLIRYLLRHLHTTPFEMIEFKFHCSMPIFVARQWIRHRTANVNEMSGRYSILPDKFYLPGPSEIRKQSTSNKQSSDGQIEESDALGFSLALTTACEHAYYTYTKAIEAGVGREQARMLLPVNLYSEWYWKCDLHNILHFLRLRCDSHAQYEMRVFGDAMLDLITPLVPWTIEAWNDYNPYRGAVTFSRLEFERLKEIIQKGEGIYDEGYSMSPCATSFLEEFPLKSGNKREDVEWVEKLTKLGVRQ